MWLSQCVLEAIVASASARVIVLSIVSTFSRPPFFVKYVHKTAKCTKLPCSSTIHASSALIFQLQRLAVLACPLRLLLRRGPRNFLHVLKVLWRWGVRGLDHRAILHAILWCALHDVTDVLKVLWHWGLPCAA